MLKFAQLLRSQCFMTEVEEELKGTAGVGPKYNEKQKKEGKCYTFMTTPCN
jgi:hypothetical protein